MIRRKAFLTCIVAAACASSSPVRADVVPSVPVASPASSAAAVRPTVGPETWMRADSPNFTLYGQVSEARLRSIAIRLEIFRAALAWLQPGVQPSPRETAIFVFKDAASGLAYSPPAAGGGHHLGANAPFDQRNFVILAAPTDDPPLDLLYHAYAHQFLDDNFPRLPLTFSEGLAEFYSGFTMTAAEALFGTPRMEHVIWLKEHPLPPLALQLPLDARAPQLAKKDDRAGFMAASWALAHYLVSTGGDDRARLLALLGSLQRGTSPHSAIYSTYGLSMAVLQQQVEQYLKGGHFEPIVVRRNLPGPATGIVVGPMANDETLAALGELLAHAGTQRFPDAEAYFREALRLNPARASAHAGLGYMEYAANRFDAAVPHLEKAVEIDPTAMTCYLLARALLKNNLGAGSTAGGQPAYALLPPDKGAAAISQTPPALARARALLTRAIQLRPQFAALYVTLGATHILPDGDVTLGIDLLQRAHTMLPARMDIVGNLVYLQLRKGDLPKAQKLVDDVLVTGGDQTVLESAQRAIITYRENLQAKKDLEKNRPTPGQEKALQAYQAEMVKKLRVALNEATDPAIKKRIQDLLDASERPPSPYDGMKGIDTFNQAVDLANRRDYAKAIALLEDLQAKSRDADLLERTKAMLERFRQDAARLQQSIK